MRPADLARLTALAAIWGAAFMLMRVAAPALGPLAIAALRVAIAGVALLAWFCWRRTRLDLVRDARHHLLIGLVNSALPFALYGYAALTLPAADLAILNATAPLFGAAFGALWLGERLTLARGAGLLLGLAGVALVVQPSAGGGVPGAAGAVAACLAASACYAAAGHYLKRRAAHLTPPATAVGSQLGAAVVLLPLLPVAGMPGPVDLRVMAAVLVLALACSALAYLLYFRLMQDMGPARALSVTFLIPVFAVAWGAIFLGEPVTAPMLAGGLLVAAGLRLVLPATRADVPSSGSPASGGLRRMNEDS